jgi:hypothetical protein
MRKNIFSIQMSAFEYKYQSSTVMTISVGGGRSPFEVIAPAEQSTPRYWKSLQMYTGQRIAGDFQNSICV